MDYRLKIGEETVAASLATTAEKNVYRARLGDSERLVRTISVAPHCLQLQLDGEVRLACHVAEAAEGLWVWNDGRARLVGDADRVERRSGRRGPGGGPSEVTPPTPSTVVAVLVEVGQAVEKGAPCVVVSAMKMEITLAAPYAGAVTAVNTAVGAKANPGEILVEIAPAAENGNEPSPAGGTHE